MTFPEFLNQCKENNLPVFTDGGMGTMIQASGVTDFALPEELNFTHPDVIQSIHRQYLEAGADIITTNTFGASPAKMKGCSLSPAKTIEAAVGIAKKAVEEFTLAEEKNGRKASPKFVALDIGPAGSLIEPTGKLTFEEACASFGAAAKAGEKAGADLAIIETIADLYEMKAAIIGVKENTSLPVIATMTFQENLRTLSGADVLTTVTYLESLGVSAIGMNCGVSLDAAEKIAADFAKYASIPVIMQPNAGLPQLENGKTVFKVSPETFAESQLRNRQKGVMIFGGCCGTTPSHIAAERRLILNETEPAFNADKTEKRRTRICSGCQTVQIGDENGAVIIGERINPTGKKKCKEALLNNDMQFILGEAENQINAGSHILDVNVGLPGINEKEMMTSVLFTLQKTFPATPLQIDSSEPDVLEQAMRRYNGKPLVNSVNGKQKVMDAVFPLVKKYGGCVVALCLDEDGIPPSAEGRLKIAEKIIAEAAKYGIPSEHLVFDMLTLTISSQQKEAAETLKGIAKLKAQYGDKGVKTVLGVSNISFGLPRRDIVNSYFFGMALNSGLDACIINPLSASMMDAYRSYRAVYALDENCMDYIQTYANTTAPTANPPSSGAAGSASGGTANGGNPASGNTVSGSSASGPAPESGSEKSGLFACIEKGFSGQAASETQKLLEKMPPMQIVNDCIVPALDNVGKDYASGRKFLPQLLLSAETVSNSFAVLKAYIAANGGQQEIKGRIIMATVHGDIHDIGKNIVVAMLENYGYEVTDLGKDVPPEVIIKTALEKKIFVIGLSALMTTTVLSMEQTIKLLREEEKKQTALGRSVFRCG